MDALLDRVGKQRMCIVTMCVVRMCIDTICIESIDSHVYSVY